MHLLDRQMGTEARKVLSHMTKTCHQNQSNKNDPQSQRYSDSNEWGGGKVWEREQESLMGKSLQGGPWPAKGWGRHVWDSWEGTGINRAVSHRPERANGLCLSLHLSPTGKSGISSGSPCVTGSSQFLLTLTTYSAAKCNVLCRYLPVIC